jgi:hypothetical protein
VLGVIAVAFLGSVRAAPVPVRAPAFIPSTDPSSHQAAAPASTAIPLGWWTYLSDQRQLDLPAGSGDAVLTSMPDRYLNDPLPAAFRVPVTVRGTTGIAAAGPPAALIWTEGDLSYSISSATLTIPQLVDLASALR